MALVTFLVMHATPGSPLDPVAEGANPLSPEAQKNLAEIYGLDKPLPEQFAIFLGKAARGDFGTSFVYKTRTVAEILREPFPVSLLLGALALALAVVGGLALGILAAVYQNRMWDYVSVSLATVGVAVPNFVLAVFLIILFSFVVPLFPTGGWNSPRDWVLPTVTLALAPMGIIARFTRASMLEVIRADFTLTARAKGLGERAVIFKHALKNAFIPVVTLLGPMFAAVVDPRARRPAPLRQEPPRDGGRRGDPPALPRRGLRRRAGAAAVHEDQLRPPQRGALAGVPARHRPGRARSTLADDLRRARVHARRARRADHRRADRRADRSPLRVPRRPRRHLSDALHRRHVRLPAAPLRHPRHVRAGRRAHEHLHRDRPHRLGRDRAADARAGARDQRERVRGRGARPRGRLWPPPHAPHPAQRADADRRLGHLRDPGGDLHRGGAVVHRRRHQPADPVLGTDGRRGAAVHPLLLAPLRVPVDRHRGHHAVVHVLRRRGP